MNAIGSVNMIAMTEQVSNASNEAFTHLALSADNCELERIAGSPLTTIETLIRLASHPSVEVRMAVAENDQLPLSTLIILANDESADVRYRVAESPNIDICVLEMLVEDSNPYVSWRALTTLWRIRSAQSKELRCAA